MNIQHDDQQVINKMMTTADQQMLELAKQKTIEFAKLMSYYKCAMMTLEAKLNVLNEEYSLEFDHNPISSIKTRLKSPFSIKDKLARKNIPFTLSAIEENVNDVAGIRVICSFPDDVYALANALLKQDDISLLLKKDYIETPKSNGYRSLHLIVSIPIYLSNEKRSMKVEIQLRTIAMDFWASLEHQLRYKKDSAFTDEMANELYQCAQLSAALDLRMDALRKNVVSENEKLVT